MEGSGWEWMGVDGSGWEWIGVSGSGWEWGGVNESGWEWMGVDGRGWEWMGEGGSGWEWMGAQIGKARYEHHLQNHQTCLKTGLMPNGLKKKEVTSNYTSFREF